MARTGGMTYCEECKERLYPMNPEIGFYHLRFKRYFVPLCQGCPRQEDKVTDTLEDRISNLEAISALSGQIPRTYYDQLQQLQGQVVFLQNALNAALERGKKRAKEQVAKQPIGKEQIKKSTYRGLGGKS